MPSMPTKRYERIDLRDPTEVALWTGALNVRAEDLERAIAAVGNAAEDVVVYLLDHELIQSASLVAALRTLPLPQYA
jgi:hypothetical protein